MNSSGSIPWGWLGSLVGLGMLLAAIAVLLRRGSGEGSGKYGPSGGDSALDILRQRYAAGDIGQDEYERARSVLLDGWDASRSTMGAA